MKDFGLSSIENISWKDKSNCVWKKLVSFSDNMEDNTLEKPIKHVLIIIKWLVAIGDTRFLTNNCFSHSIFH